MGYVGRQLAFKIGSKIKTGSMGPSQNLKYWNVAFQKPRKSHGTGNKGACKCPEKDVLLQGNSGVGTEEKQSA